MVDNLSGKSCISVSSVASQKVSVCSNISTLNFDLHSLMNLMTYAITLSSLHNQLKFSQQIMLPRLLDPLVAGELHMRWQCVVLISFKHSSGISKLSSSNSVFMSTSQSGACLHNLQLANSAAVIHLN